MHCFLSSFPPLLWGQLVQYFFSGHNQSVKGVLPTEYRIALRREAAAGKQEMVLSN